MVSFLFSYYINLDAIKNQVGCYKLLSHRHW